MPSKATAPSSKSASRNGRISDDALCVVIPGHAQREPGISRFRVRCYAPPRDDKKENMNHDTYSDDYIRGILNSVKSIAMVGASPVDVRPSYFAFKYLMQRGYEMIPVNPGHVGKSLLGRPFVGSLAEIGHPVDMVEIFRS